MEFPKMLYRPGDEITWEGKSLDTLIVETEADEAAAIKEGWQANPFTKPKRAAHGPA